MVDQLQIYNRRKSYERKESLHCTIFLDVSQSFHKIWHEELLMHKLKNMLSENYCKIFLSYLTDQFFRINHIYRVIPRVAGDKRWGGIRQGNVYYQNQYCVLVRCTLRIYQSINESLQQYIRRLNTSSCGRICRTINRTSTTTPQ